MREIKFRQWNSRHKRMRYGIGATKGCWTGFESVDWENDPIMQFTGLLDKNGKEIHEGDIVKTKVDVGFVYWHDSLCAFTNVFGADCEVIGNLYENPELVKEVK